MRLRAAEFPVTRGVMKTILLISLSAASLLTVSCNTFIGVGRDTRMLGEGMEKVADKASGGSADGGGGEDVSGAPVY